MGRCLSILAMALVSIGLVITAGMPRITPFGSGPGGLCRFDFVLMVGVPLGAFAAGRHWYRHELFLLYGAAGILLFVPPYLSDNNLRHLYTEPYGDVGIDAMLHDTAAWTIATVAMAVVCMFLARWARRRFPVRRAS